MDLEIEFKPYQPSNKEELIEFIRQYPRLPYTEKEFQVFSGQLSQSPASVLDVWQSGRAAVAVLIDKCQSVDGAIELGIFGFRWNLSGVLFLDYSLPRLWPLVRKAGGKSIDVLSFVGARLSPGDLTSKGFQLLTYIQTLTRPAIEETGRQPLPAGYTLAPVNKESVEDYYLLFKNCFKERCDAFFPEKDLFISRSLSFPIPPQLLLQNGKPIGFYRIGIDKKVGELEAVGVEPAHQKKGLGQYLIKEALHVLKEKGAEKFSLSVAENNPARLLYEKQGFKKSRQVGQYRLLDPKK